MSKEENCRSSALPLDSFRFLHTRARENQTLMERTDIDSSKSNIRPEDVYWDGGDESIDKFGYLEALEILLAAVIWKYPNRKNPSDRLRDALSALVSARKPNGRRRESDEDVLLDVAWQYHCRLFEGGNAELAPLIRESLARKRGRDANRLKRQSGGDENFEVLRIRNKFQKDKDRLLTVVTHEMDEERRVFYVRLMQAAKCLEALGIMVDVESINPRFARERKST